jgi:endonuclease/exonuclease/phosphatase (EEP) superfamily protein YafD
MSHYPTPRTKPLTLLQLNVGRGASLHEIALSLAFSENIDIILIQESYVYKGLSRRITKRHLSYECSAPTDDWTVSGRPRVLTYIQKGTGIYATQVRPNVADPTVLSNLLFLYLASPSGQTLLVTNVYNAPLGSIRAGEAARTLTLLPLSFFTQPSFLAGDLNLPHSRWQPSLQHSPTTFANPFVTWLDHSQLVFISETDCPTHNKGNVLDLAFVSGPLALVGASSIVAHI